MREVIKEGRDVNEAIELACTQLGVERGQVSFEIIELPKTSFFGLLKKNAKVRVYIDEPAAPKAPPAKPAPKAEPPKPVERRPEPRPAPPVAQREAKPAPAQPAPKPAERPAAPVQSAPQPDAAPAAPVREGREEPLVFFPMEQAEGKAQVACEYIKSVLIEMGVDAKLSVARTESGVVIRLSGDGLGVIIGRRGETLDSLQYLSGLVANRLEGDYMRVTIDTGNYREKRERTLQQLARKLSATAIRSGRSTMLESMNPYERRIIHSTVSTIEGVSSSSVGEEPNRRVVITPSNAKPRYPKRPGQPGGNDTRRPPNQGGGRRPPRYNSNRSEGAPGGENRAPAGEYLEPAPRRFEGETRRPAVPAAAPTSTAVDREYAKELEKTVSAPKPVPTPEVRERVVRDKPKDEAGNLPLYGKIDL